MDYYSHTNNKILIGHFPGHTRDENADLINEIKERKFTLPDNIDIVSVISKDHIDTAPLHYQLTKNGYEYINSIKNRNMSWNRVQKIKLVLESLSQCTKEYSLILDGDDVVIFDDLDDIIDKFNSYNKKIIYNSSIWMYPHVIVDMVDNRGQYGEYCYLNAGCCFGKTADLIEFYTKVWKIADNCHYKYNSEQYYVRKIFNKNQDEVFFDWQCKLFQCWHKAEYKYNDDKTICYLK